MKTKELEKRLRAADKLLRGETTTRAKFESIRTQLKGINSRLDQALAKTSKALKKLEQVQKGKVIDLTLEHLPEKTKQQKKRKKALLLFFRYWKQLRSEVKRVKKELKSQQSSPHPPVVKKASTFTKIMASAKGPLGLITALAVGLAAAGLYLSANSVRVTITNQNCQTINPRFDLPVKIPGLELPDQPITAGGQATMKLPPLKFTVDGTGGRQVLLKAYGLKFNFALENASIDVLLNDTSLLGTRTTVKLGSQPEHQLVIQCPTPTG